MTPVDLIIREYGVSRNLMTPEIVRFGWIREGVLAYELSTGTGLDGSRIYGVSVVEYIASTDLTERRVDLSTVLFSRQGADDYIQTLKERYA